MRTPHLIDPVCPSLSMFIILFMTWITLVISRTAARRSIDTLLSRSLFDWKCTHGPWYNRDFLLCMCRTTPYLWPREETSTRQEDKNNWQAHVQLQSTAPSRYMQTSTPAPEARAWHIGRQSGVASEAKAPQKRWRKGSTEEKHHRNRSGRTVLTTRASG